MTRKSKKYQLLVSALLLCFLQVAGIDVYAQSTVTPARKDTTIIQREAPKARARRHRDPIIQDSVKKDSIQIIPSKELPAIDSLSAAKIQIADSLDAANKKELKKIEQPASIVVKTDSVPPPAQDINKKIFIPNPTKATWLAVVFPGGGQIYNRKYWKLPIIYGGFAGCAYALSWNGKMYKDYSQAYLDIMDSNPNTKSYEDLLPPNSTYNEEQLKNTLKRRKDMFRRYRDLSIFAFIGVYLISIIDAYVDAELSNFDITPDLSKSVDVVIRENGTERKESIDLPKSMTYPLDSLLNDWKAKNYIDLGKDCSTAEINPLFSDSVYIDRLSRIPAIMEMPYNDIIRKFIDMYAGRLRNQVSFMLSACNFYMPIFEEALDAYGLPLELRYLPIIESALNPSAVSRAGASGLWQFMIGTGKIYGLESNSLVDERRDPIKATWAAARYLKEMYDIYGDWNLVIAAYNCGPGTINKAIRRANGETDYWKIYNYLPKETRGYVPAFIAANYVMTYYCDHNICPMETNIPASTDTVQVNKNLHFEQIADLCNVPLDQIKSLNPQYKKQMIPGDSKPYTLRLPIDAISTFIDKQDTIYAHRADELFRNRKTVAVKEITPSTRKTTTAVAGKGKLTYYTIKSGDTLSTIAGKYGVTIKDIQRWNGMSNTKIAAGKRLKIYK